MKIGDGAFGDVYKISDDEVKKCYDKEPDSVDTGVLNPQEIDILCSYNHPSLCYAKSLIHRPNIFNKKCNTIDIVLPYAKHGSLTMFMDNIERGNIEISLQTKLYMIFQIVIGIKFLHDNNIIHLDLKAANILIDTDINDNIKVMITDFGTCQYTPPCLWRNTNTDKVTIDFRPPENMVRRKNKFIHSNHSDTWSFGLIMLYILKGTPFYDPKKLYDDSDKCMKYMIDRNNRFFKKDDKLNNLNKYLDNIVDLNIKNQLISILDKIFIYIDTVNIKNCDVIERCDLNDIINSPIFDEFRTIDIKGSIINPKENYDNPIIINNKVFKYIYNIIIYNYNMDEHFVRTDTVYLAISLFWRYMYINNLKDDDKLELLSLAVFWLSYKMIETEYISFTMINKRINDVINMEADIIMALKGNLYPMLIHKYKNYGPYSISIFDIYTNPKLFYKIHSEYNTNIYDNYIKNIKMNDITYRLFRDFIKNSQYINHNNPIDYMINKYNSI